MAPKVSWTAGRPAVKLPIATQAEGRPGARALFRAHAFDGEVQSDPKLRKAHCGAARVGKVIYRLLRTSRGFAVCCGAPGDGSLVVMPDPNSHSDLASRIEAKKTAWTAEDLAALLEMSSKTLYKMAKSGRIPAIRIDGMIRFDPALTAEWLRARTTGMGFRQKEAA